MANNNKEIILSNFSKVFSNIKYLIISGSFSNGTNIDSWSDIDLLLVLDNITFKDYIATSKISKDLKDVTSFEVSIDLISSNDINHINAGFVKRYHPKIIQTLIEADLDKSKVIYQNGDFIINISDKDVRNTSINNVNFFYQEIIKNLTRSSQGDMKQIKAVLKIIIKRIFNLLKMGIQSIELTPPQNKSLVIKLTEKYFPDLNNKLLYELQTLRKNWLDNNDKEKMIDLLEKIYIYSNEYYEVYSRVYLTK